MNLTRVNSAPEVYSLTESRNVRASETWKTSGTRSGECVSIFPDGTRLPFSAAKSRTRKNRVTVVTSSTTYFDRLAKYGATAPNND